jgi:demethylmenaquinone methyltransferase/2-methoxy-6-polyprenyl-1,4-benzoquinol methylase
MPPNLDRYERIAPFYDLLDLPFETWRYRALRPLLFNGLAGRLLDAGVGTGRNFPFYPAGSSVVGIDISPSMLARAERRRGQSNAALELQLMDVTNLTFAADSFDAAVSTFLFCVLPENLQVPALRELARVVKPGEPIRLLEYVRPQNILRRVVARVWEPWMHWAYGASFDRHTEQHVAAAGLEVVSSRFVVPDLLKLISLRTTPFDNV